MLLPRRLELDNKIYQEVSIQLLVCLKWKFQYLVERRVGNFQWNLKPYKRQHKFVADEHLYGTVSNDSDFSGI